MSRASVTEALILRASRVGEYHKQLLLLTPDTGLVKALAFGAFKGKSRLVSASDPYSHARIHLYRNPVRDLLKITDIEVIHTYEGLRNDLERSYAAALLAELVAASYGGGGPDYRYPFGLLRRCLMVLETGDARAGRRTVFQFLLRFLLHAGFLGSPGECGRCGADPALWKGPSRSLRGYGAIWKGLQNSPCPGPWRSGQTHLWSRGWSACCGIFFRLP